MKDWTVFSSGKEIKIKMQKELVTGIAPNLRRALHPAAAKLCPVGSRNPKAIATTAPSVMKPIRQRE